MTPDYPAAHSMDTDWFAVDADGHVGYFESGEAGAVPHDASPGNQDQGFRLREMLAARPRCDAIHDLAGRLRPDHDDAHARMTDGTPMLFFLRIADLAERHLSGEEPVLPLRGGPALPAAADKADAALPFDAAALAPAVPGADPAETLRLQAEALAAVRDAVKTGQAYVMPAANAGSALRVPHCRRDFYDRLHAAGLCLGCFWHWASLDPDEDEEVPEPARLGLYRYDHLTENWIAGPYGRVLVPSRPLRLDDLPAPFRRLVGRVRFALKFADTPHIQPVEHHPCSAWGGQYLTSGTHEERPIPGYEDADGDTDDAAEE